MVFSVDILCFLYVYSRVGLSVYPKMSPKLFPAQGSFFPKKNGMQIKFCFCSAVQTSRNKQI